MVYFCCSSTAQTTHEGNWLPPLHIYPTKDIHMAWARWSPPCPSLFMTRVDQSSSPLTKLLVLQTGLDKSIPKPIYLAVPCVGSVEAQMFALWLDFVV
jgi:hypothetical protein